MAPDAVGEEGARAEVARDELLHVRVPDLVQRGDVGGGLVVCSDSACIIISHYIPSLLSPANRNL